MGLLRGRDHTRIGRPATVAEAEAAAAISRGGAHKTYAYVDENEDCAGFARGPGGVVLAVADAHNGREASEIAVETVLERWAPRWTSATARAEPWAEDARAAVRAAHDAVIAQALASGNPESRTTLAVGLLRPGEGQLCWASIGDSHVFRVADDGATELGAGSDTASWFVGSARRTPAEIAEHVRVGCEPCAGVRALVLATDGLSENKIGVLDPARAVTDAVRQALDTTPDLRALTAARTLVQIAQAAHQENRAGDNVAVALGWAG